MEDIFSNFVHAFDVREVVALRAIYLGRQEKNHVMGPFSFHMIFLSFHNLSFVISKLVDIVAATLADQLVDPLPF